MKKGSHHTPEARAKISAARKGKRLSPEHRAKLLEANLRRMAAERLTKPTFTQDKTGRWSVQMRKGGYYSWYRVLMWNETGRELTSTEVVHHINGDVSDDRIENLAVMSNGEHVSLHLRQGDIHEFTAEERALAARRASEWVKAHKPHTFTYEERVRGGRAAARNYSFTEADRARGRETQRKRAEQQKRRAELEATEG